ncbi:hypothetical protein BK665_11885 [Pseudomonas frederiksbergensis]|uniref:Uncharacterized protein n=2 Tax=Pseudomonas frederiksbergensis TaxID=104087 RepID=A0A423KM98_9PSED|nr:hypothetical protein BK665_11885 [Pseudomonas frederiksbergensis]
MTDFNDVNDTVAVDLPGRLDATASSKDLSLVFDQNDTVAYRVVDDVGLQFIDSRPVGPGDPTRQFRLNIGVSINATPKEYLINDATTDALVMFRGQGGTNKVIGGLRVIKNDATGLAGEFNGTCTLGDSQYKIMCPEFRVDK